MANTSAPPSWKNETDEDPESYLRQTLDALLEFTGAAAGCIGLTDAQGRLTFPARTGVFPEGWLKLQQGHEAVWGFEVREGPALLNEMPQLPALGQPSLHNLLTCPLSRADKPIGHILLANKPQGFTSQDSTVLQTAAYLLAHHLQRARPTATAAIPAALLRSGMDRIHEGVLIVEETGNLLFANAAWCRWTGFSPEELIGRPAPFPFWVSHCDLATLGRPSSGLPRNPVSGTAPATSIQPSQISYLPFRHRNHSLFWCQVETLSEERNGRRVTFAFLRQLPSTAPTSPDQAGSAVSFLALADDLPFAAALTDDQGHVVWANQIFAAEFKPAHEVVGQSLPHFFTPITRAALERLIREKESTARQQRGQLILQRQGAAQDAAELVAYWQTVALPQGPGLLCAFAENWAEIWNSAATERPLLGSARPPALDCLALQFRPGATIEFWDERWERLTGLSAQDLAGVSGELVLDWLLPRQRDREFVADLLNEPARRSAQAILDFAGRNGGRSLLCTFLPVTSNGDAGMPRALHVAPPAAAPREESWLILASEPVISLSADNNMEHFLRQFTRGLAHLLNNYLTPPIGLAEMALDRNDLPAELSATFHHILESCMRAGRLVAALQDLAAESPGDRQRLSLAEFVREFLGEQLAGTQERDYELEEDLKNEEALVEVNPRMLKVVLENLLSNALQALTATPPRRIQFRIEATTTEVRCEIHDSGEGLPTTDWTAVLAPFYSTKGSFAQGADQRNIDALGLGLTVSQHLLALHGGRLELHSVRGKGTTAVLTLPRVARVPGGNSAAVPEPLRAKASE